MHTGISIVRNVETNNHCNQLLLVNCADVACPTLLMSPEILMYPDALITYCTNQICVLIMSPNPLLSPRRDRRSSTPLSKITPIRTGRRSTYDRPHGDTHPAEKLELNGHCCW